MTLFVILIFLSGCQQNWNCQDPIGCINLIPGQPLTIGIEKATTGDESAISQSMIDVVKYAASQKPLFFRHPIQFYIQDTPCTNHDHALATGLTVSQPDLAAVIGPVCQEGIDAYAKTLSDAGFSLFSAATRIDGENYPGVYNLLPSTQALAESLDSLLFKTADIRNIDLVVWNQTPDIQFSQEFCAIWQKHGFQCEQTLSLQPDNLPPSIDSSQLADPSTSMIFILPFGRLEQVSDLVDLPDLQRVLFFDPELSTWDRTQDPMQWIRQTVTYQWPDENGSPVNFPSTIQPQYRSLLAYDAYQMLIQSLTESIDDTPGGKITILRQKLRQSIEKIVDFNGLAGLYSCANGFNCLQTTGFLELRMPNR
jgi:ABC-type branched-subunit amino acid transport system substrate-binding protein